MQTISIILGYLKWHYGRAIRSLGQVWGNFLIFTYDFFSIKLLYKNFFDPWKRMSDSYPKSFDFKKYFYAFITNLIVRLVGIIMRLVLLGVGLICYILLAILYLPALIIWLLLPFIVIFLIGSGLFLIISK